MNADRMQDMVARGLGRAATMLGAWCDAYRPATARCPLDPAHRFLRLQAAFAPPDGRFTKPVGHDEAVWTGIFDSAYTRVGDYIVRDGADPGVWFVAAQQPSLPVLCIRTTGVVGLRRAAAAIAPGANGYGGINRETASVLLQDWPAAVLASRGAGLDAALPGDATDGSWRVLLPVLPKGINLRSGDLMLDDAGRAGVVTSAEASALGWKLAVRQAAA